MTSRDDLAKRREAEAERIAISLARQKGEDRDSWSLRVEQQRAATRASKDAYRDFIWEIAGKQGEIRQSLGLSPIGR